ncbi:hypothetical protein TL16_g10139 [Triparma laevis f. inornata]|uniref:CCT domain-containing protein n=2 Tax=Triparma laevis TaxID=1534972 RepID=A0A9W7A1E3_9STRA|nr:hypothetical protein TrLO_g7552 [Triparma laevis f. longispina]GMH85161.1 hypothetical protein TL16_g10139 [Triparma laevis f. inornata]
MIDYYTSNNVLPHETFPLQYSTSGNIGIYTPSERSQILSKFSAKRFSRSYKKKIRYNCRKDLADRRVRVKGRFVKKEEGGGGEGGLLKGLMEVGGRERAMTIG